MKNSAFSNYKVFAGNSHLELAEEITSIMGKPLGRATVNKFSDGEISVNLWESVRGVDCYIVQSTCDPVNDNLMELLIMIDAMKRASAGRINAVIPYYGYARQDRKAKARDPITAKLVANLLMAAGADRVLTMDLHAAQIQGKDCILVYDMIDTAGTITNAANALKEMGAASVRACATHAVLSGPAIERIENSAIEELILLNTLPIPEEKKIEKMKMLSVAPLFAEAMTRVFTNDSISKLFD